MEVRVASGSVADRWPCVRGWVALLLFTFSAVLCAGCGPRPAARLDVLVDSSASTAATRDGAAAPLTAVLQAVGKLLPRRPRVVVWQFAQEVGVVDDAVPQRVAELRQMLQQARRHTAAGRGTHPARALAELPASWAATPEQVLAVVVVTDGETADAAALRRAVAGLVAEPRLRAVWLVGLQERLWVASQQAYAPLGSRLLLSGAAGTGLRTTGARFVAQVREGL